LLAAVLDPFTKSIDSAIPPPLIKLQGGGIRPERVVDDRSRSQFGHDPDSDAFPGRAPLTCSSRWMPPRRGVTLCLHRQSTGDSVPQHAEFSCGGSFPFLNVASGHHSIQASFSGSGHLAVSHVVVKVQRIDQNSVFVSLHPPIP
jgi:hypothetical protein